MAPTFRECSCGRAYFADTDRHSCGHCGRGMIFARRVDSCAECSCRRLAALEAAAKVEAARSDVAPASIVDPNSVAAIRASIAATREPEQERLEKLFWAQEREREARERAAKGAMNG